VIVGIETTSVASCFCELPGRFLLVSSCPESVRLLKEFYLRVNVTFALFRSTSDMVFSLRQLQEKSVEQSRPLHVVFIDLTKAFDTVSRSGLYNILKLLGCPEMLLSIPVAFHENMKARVQFDGSMSKTFPICRGVKHGCILAPTLFGIFFSADFAHIFPQEDGIMFHTRSTGGLFNLPQLRAETKTKHVLIREFCMSMMLPYLLTLRCTCKTCVNILLRLAMTSV